MKILSIADEKICIFSNGDCTKLAGWFGEGFYNSKIGLSITNKIVALTKGTALDTTHIGAIYRVPNDSVLNFIASLIGVNSKTIKLPQTPKDPLKRVELKKRINEFKQSVFPALPLPTPKETERYKKLLERKTPTEPKRKAIDTLLELYKRQAKELCKKIRNSDKQLKDDEGLMRKINTTK